LTPNVIPKSRGDILGRLFPSDRLILAFKTLCERKPPAPAAGEPVERIIADQID